MGVEVSVGGTGVNVSVGDETIVGVKVSGWMNSSVTGNESEVGFEAGEQENRNIVKNNKVKKCFIVVSNLNCPILS